MNTVYKSKENMKNKNNMTQERKKNNIKKSQVIVLLLGKNIVDIKARKPGKTSKIIFFSETQEKFYQ